MSNLGPRTTPSAYFEDEAVTLYLCDAKELLPLLGDVDACVTDPPYGETSLSWDQRVSGWPSLAEHLVVLYEAKR